MGCRNKSGNDNQIAFERRAVKFSSMAQDKVYTVYLLASRHYGTLYIGVTSDLVNRVTEHRSGYREGFTRDYGIHRLVWYEEFGDVLHAIQREKTMKKWPRQWKINLIERDNPHWVDLYPTFFHTPPKQF
jgi:putative endonuclease